MIVVRRLPMVVVTVAAFVAVGVLARDSTSPVDAVFSDVSAPWMPAAPMAGGLTSTWFCPGVPASGADRTAGHVTVFNAEDHAVEARATFLVDGDRADAVLTKPYQVPAFGSTDIDVDALVDSQFAAVVVEIDGGGGLVEQRAVGPVGTSTAESVTACANSPASHWYLATGATADDDNEDLVLSNPYDEAAIVDVTLRTSAGTRTPDRFQNFTIPRQSVRVISLEDAAGPDEVEPRGERRRQPRQLRARPVADVRQRHPERLRDVAGLADAADAVVVRLRREGRRRGGVVQPVQPGRRGRRRRPVAARLPPRRRLRRRVDGAGAGRPDR